MLVYKHFKNKDEHEGNGLPPSYDQTQYQQQGFSDIPKVPFSHFVPQAAAANKAIDVLNRTVTGGVTRRKTGGGGTQFVKIKKI